MFQNGFVEIDKLDKFLGLDVDESLKGEIIEMCDFDNMSADKKQDLEQAKEKWFTNDFMFFRKGNFERINVSFIIKLFLNEVFQGADFNSLNSIRGMLFLYIVS